MARRQPVFATGLRTPRAGMPCPALRISTQRERSYARQMLFDRLFTWPADQPRHATSTLIDPVESNRPRGAPVRTVEVRTKRLAANHVVRRFTVHPIGVRAAVKEGNRHSRFDSAGVSAIHLLARRAREPRRCDCGVSTPRGSCAWARGAGRVVGPTGSAGCRPGTVATNAGRTGPPTRRGGTATSVSARTTPTTCSPVWSTAGGPTRRPRSALRATVRATES
jgi:hypothetical protein